MAHIQKNHTEIAKDIYGIIGELNENNSTNYKLEVLTKYKDNKELANYLYYCYTPLYNFFIKKIPEHQSNFGMDTTNEELNMFELLDTLRKREVTGHDAIEVLSYYLNNSSFETQELIKLALNRDIASGVSIKSFNKVFDNLIETIPYMRCEKLDEKTMDKIVYPALVQKKSDGTFANIIIHNNEVTFMTRNGSTFYIPTLEKELLAIFPNQDLVLTGEMLIYNGDVEENRKIGNGLITSFIKQDSTLSTLDEKIEAASPKAKITLESKKEELLSKFAEVEGKIKFDVWDVVDYKDWKNEKSLIPYQERLNSLKSALETHNSKSFMLIETKEVKTFEEASAYAQDMIANGFEGAVLKNKHGIWEDGTSSDQIKLKNIIDADLRCVGWNPGKENSEFSMGIGGLILESEDKKLRVIAGTGLSREQRGLEPIDKNDLSLGLKVIDGFDFNQYNGKIIEVQANDVITSKTKETASLFLPRFIVVREDKNVADTLDRIVLGSKSQKIMKESLEHSHENGEDVGGR